MSFKKTRKSERFEYNSGSKGADCSNAGFLFRGIQTDTASPANSVSERIFSDMRVRVIKTL